jgi:aminopeptidase YwaD
MKHRPSLLPVILCLGLLVPAAAVSAQVRFPAALGAGLHRIVESLPGPSARRPPATPLPRSVLDILANEVSGQMAYNNEVLLAGAPIVRDEKELTGTFFETSRICELARAAGLDNARILRYPGQGTFTYPLEAELWLVRPSKSLIARLGADAALVAQGSGNADLTADLVYVPPPDEETVKALLAGGPQERYKGKVALMWSHPQRQTAQALDAAGLAGVIAFNAEDRYADPDQIVYSGGPYARMKNMTFGLTVSWRQWSELLDDLEHGRKPAVRCRIVSKTYPERSEGVVASIPGTEPLKKGIVFTAHLLEGPVKRGANDNMSGCVAELEIARALTRLIRQGLLPPPRRTITFLWADEISGTRAYLAANPEFGRSLSGDVNMDMVGEGLRQNNAVFILTEATNALPSYLDGLGRSILNYLWRTNDIVYLPDSPESPRGEQVFPAPLWEKNGSRDAFRFDVQPATGGSDHICFANSSVGVPAVSLNVWPDQWYHADRDTPDKSDPTQLRRVAFVGAAMAWAAADCDDRVLEAMAGDVFEFGLSRVSRRELPAALRALDTAGPLGLAAALGRASNLLDLALEREEGALASLADIASGSSEAKGILAFRTEQWRGYARDIRGLVESTARLRAVRLGIAPPARPAPTALERKWAAVVPVVTDKVKGREFWVEASPSYREYVKAHPDAVRAIALGWGERRALVDFIDGRRSVAVIRARAEAETGTDIPLDKAVAYIEMLKDIGWLAY